ncbi:MAG TPA: hypothetical protein VJ813_14795 [Vicinamibacterales bacterium]|nr:hypothetical protein [Vicinamibacterales bacterium]
MKRYSKLMRIIGWGLVLACGSLALTTWLHLREERRLHAYRAIELDLTEESGWKDVRLHPGRSGQWRISLTTVNAFSSAEGEPPLPYRGAIEILLIDARDAVRLRKTLDGPSSGHVRPANMQWTDLVHVDLNEGEELTLRARVARADRAFNRTVSAIRAYPPQVHDMGWYSFGETVKIVLFTVGSFIGLTMVAVAGMARRRAAPQAGVSE